MIESHKHDREVKSLSVASPARLVLILRSQRDTWANIAVVPLRCQNSRFLEATVPPVSLRRLTRMQTPPSPSTLRLPTNGHDGADGLNNSESRRASQPIPPRSRSARFCTAWERKQSLSCPRRTPRKTIARITRQSCETSTLFIRSAATWSSKEHGSIAETSCQARPQRYTSWRSTALQLTATTELSRVRWFATDWFVGIRDSSLSERLQLDPNLTLEKAKKSIRQREAVHEQQGILSGTEPPSLDAVRSSKERGLGRPRDRRDRREQRTRPVTARGGARQRSSPKQCTRCGKEPHARDRCPAKNETCNKCQNIGHYGAQCRTKNVSLDESGLETAFLDATTSTTRETAWFVDISVGRHKKVTFKLDTGAEVTAVSQETYQAPHSLAPLRGSFVVHPGSPCKSSDNAALILHTTGSPAVSRFSWWKANLLGLPAIKALHLATRLDETTSTTAPLCSMYIHERFRTVFQGLGNLGEDYDEAWSQSIRTLYPTTSTSTAEREGRRGAEMHGSYGSDIKSWHSHPLMCRHGCGPKEIRCCTYMRRPQATQPKCAPGSSPPPQSRWHSGPADRSSTIQQAGCK